MNNKKTYLVWLFFIGLLSINAQQNSQLWQEVSDWDTNVFAKKARNSQPTTYKLFELDLTSLKNKLANVKSRNQTRTSNIIISFPNEEGNFERFRVFETEIMHPDLAIKYPMIKSYVAQGVDDLTATMHFSITQFGLHTMTLSGKRNDVFIDAYTTNANYYIVYTKSSVTDSTFDFECFTDEGDFRNSVTTQEQMRNDTDDKRLRTFRLALSCNAEYGNIFAVNTGTEKADITAQMVITMNRVNGIYERDLAITMQFVADNDLILYYGNTNSDPWSGEYNGTTQIEIDDKIGDGNYDIGHNFNTSGGGNAGCIGCVCTSGTKGRGYTGRPDPTGDPFDIDYVAHEMGHQFGGYHTMNTCSRSGSGATEVEPASGSSIMGYAGICNTNVQSNSDAHFNYVNIRDISANVQGGVSTCAVITNLVNNPPTANAGIDYIIPKSTPYILEGIATDPEGLGSLTYSWSQNDPEQSPGNGPPQSSYTVGPMYRTLYPTTSPNRYMPKFSDVLNASLTPTWEVTPAVGRDMEFAFLVRDNDILGGQTAADLMSVTVASGSGPFLVLSQNTAETWEAGTNETISWNVSSTDVAPVNATNVDILMTDDQGASFTSIVTNVPNTGSYAITVPNVTTSTARIMIRASNNIFYAINGADITIQQSDFDMTFNNDTEDVCVPLDATYTFTYNTYNGFNETVTFSASGNPVGSTVAFSPAQTSTGGTLITMTVSNLTDAMDGNHTINIQGTSTSANKNADVTLNVFGNTIPIATLALPTNADTNVTLPVTFNWSDENATSYDIEIATDNVFTNIVDSANINTNSYVANSLDFTNIYYWRVRVNNLCGVGNYSSVFSFITQDCTYCPSTYFQVTDDWITNVTLNTINNTSVQGGNDSYEDFSVVSTDLEIGLTYPISIDVEVDGGFLQYVKVFIDWNQDCDFDDANETLDLGSQNGTATFNGNITVPVGAFLGNTKMRIIEQYISSPEACNSHPTAFGETEDYTINVLIQSNSCLTPVSVNVINILDVSATVNWTDLNSPSNSFNIEYGIQGFTLGTGTLVNEVTTSLNLTSLLNNTAYDVYIQSDCGAEQSPWTLATTFTTLCGFYSNSYMEDFENIPLTCWSFYQSEGDDPGFVQTSLRAHNGNLSYYHNDDDIATVSESWMVSPSFLSGVNDELRFWYNQNWTENFYNYSGVWISTTGNDPLTNPGDWTELSELNAGSTGGFSEDTWTEFVQNLSAYAGQTIYIGFRYVGDYAHEFYIDDFSILPVLCAGVTKTWDGTDWLDGGSVTTAPDNTNPVIINGTYTTGTHGNINACSLENNATLTVNANTYINVIYDIVNTNSFTIEPQGSLVQIENSATVTGAGTFNTQVSTTALDDKDRFTYFSSPATNNSLTVFDAWSETNKIWEFVGSTQYWNNVPNSTTMQTGYGYAVRGSTLGTYPLIATSTFNNAFNNGEFTMPLYFDVGTSESDSADDDSVLLGNPYPSAIDAAMLLTNNPQANAFYIWTHASALGSGSYVADDYIIWNASGGVASASGEPVLNGYIASGQGFFVQSNASGNFVFSNDVRVNTNNNDFRSNQDENNPRLWLNITSNSGLFNQILLAFSTQATNQFDTQKDAKRLIENTNLSFYSFDEVNEQFAIQTRKEVTEEDVIPLGFHVQDTSVNQMQIAISTIEFFEDTNVYLKDNVLNVIHDLKLEPYDFTLIDQVNNEERFEIILTRDALSTISDSLNNDLMVYMIEDDLINIQMMNGAIIKQVKIYDVLGKMLTNLKVDNSIIKIPTTVNTGTILFLNITLENGQSLIKKMIVNK